MSDEVQPILRTATTLFSMALDDAAQHVVLEMLWRADGSRRTVGSAITTCDDLIRALLLNPGKAALEAVYALGGEPALIVLVRDRVKARRRNRAKVTRALTCHPPNVCPPSQKAVKSRRERQ